MSQHESSYGRLETWCMQQALTLYTQGGMVPRKRVLGRVSEISPAALVSATTPRSLYSEFIVTQSIAPKLRLMLTLPSLTCAQASWSRHSTHSTVGLKSLLFNCNLHRRARHSPTITSCSEWWAFYSNPGLGHSTIVIKKFSQRTVVAVVRLYFFIKSNPGTSYSPFRESQIVELQRTAHSTR